MVANEVKLEPYRRLKDDVRQTLLKTLYNHDVEAKYAKKNPDGSIDATLDGRFYKLTISYDTMSHKYLCYIHFKSDTFLIGTIPSKSKNKQFNTDLVRLITMQGGNEGLNRHIDTFKIKNIDGKFESFLCLK